MKFYWSKLFSPSLKAEPKAVTIPISNYKFLVVNYFFTTNLPVLYITLLLLQSCGSVRFLVGGLANPSTVQLCWGWVEMVSGFKSWTNITKLNQQYQNDSQCPKILHNGKIQPNINNQYVKIFKNLKNYKISQEEIKLEIPE